MISLDTARALRQQDEDERDDEVYAPNDGPGLAHSDLTAWAREHVTFVAPDGRTLTEEEAAEWLRRARS